MAKVWHRSRASGDDWIVDIRDRDGVRHRFSASTREEADSLLVDKTNEYREPEKLIGDPEILSILTPANGWRTSRSRDRSSRERSRAIGNFSTVISRPHSAPRSFEPSGA